MRLGRLEPCENRIGITLGPGAEHGVFVTRGQAGVFDLCAERDRPRRILRRSKLSQTRQQIAACSGQAARQHLAQHAERIDLGASEQRIELETRAIVLRQALSDPLHRVRVSAEHIEQS